MVISGLLPKIRINRCEREHVESVGNAQNVLGFEQKCKSNSSHLPIFRLFF